MAKKKIKKVSTKKLKGKLWKLFSLWVRLREADKLGYSSCISCGKSYHFKSMNAGHFIHGTWTKLTGLDERNVWSQCVFCNVGADGNHVGYLEGLRKKIGQDEIDALLEIRHQIWKPSTQEIEDLIKTYEVKLNFIKELQV